MTGSRRGRSSASPAAGALGRGSATIGPRRRMMLLALVLVGSLTAACSGPSSTPPSSPAASPPAPSPPAVSTARPTTATAATSAAAGDWTSYHADDARTGAITAGPSLDPATRAWSVDLGGAVRGQPLVADGRVVAATETNRVVSLNPRTGAIEWSTTIGQPLTDVASRAGCGNIDPLGITGTPVIDTATSTVYVLGEIDDHGTVQHRLVGLDLATGKQTFSAPADPPLPAGESTVNLLQRPGLALRDGMVYVAYGGNFGDCGHYHGWLVGIDVSGHATPMRVFEVAPGDEGGAIWSSGGAPAIDRAGSVFVSTGNANPWPNVTPDPARYAESVVKLGSSLQVEADFKDPEASDDADLATGNPVLLADDEVFAVGKTKIGYFLRTDDLSLAASVAGVCEHGNPDGGPAYDAATHRLFVPCRGEGIRVIDTATHRLGPMLHGADNAPVVVGHRVWALNAGTSSLVAFDAGTLARQQSVPVGADVPVFVTPSVGAGVLLVGTARGVTAFRSGVGARASIRDHSDDRGALLRVERAVHRTPRPHPRS